ncbi:hypothetical protein CDAR_190061 [Caerostris darwini]|uniref:Uncharacterized protein n=1 Tax=Caerostris darwini TaxID=1538125 RepID=A0AAV4RIQ4_9ARAC|nr:hypothetical protein CDAR_190061 [Caerostris darwini]
MKLKELLQFWISGETAHGFLSSLNEQNITKNESLVRNGKSFYNNKALALAKCYVSVCSLLSINRARLPCHSPTGRLDYDDELFNSDFILDELHRAVHETKTS